MSSWKGRTAFPEELRPWRERLLDILQNMDLGVCPVTTYEIDEAFFRKI